VPNKNVLSQEQKSDGVMDGEDGAYELIIWLWRSDESRREKIMRTWLTR